MRETVQWAPSMVAYLLWELYAIVGEKRIVWMGI